MKKKLIQTVIILALLVFLLIPSINPLLDDAAKAAVSAQIQDTFGGLLGGTGMLTPARLICAVAVILLVWLACDLVTAALMYFAEKNLRSRSMAGLFVSLTKFLGCIVGGVWALGILGVNLAGIFASLGIASLIIGFGAQSLIEDAVTGIFIIFEGQYHVGDIIVLDGFRGTVKRIGVRTTCIEDGGGNQKIAAPIQAGQLLLFGQRHFSPLLFSISAQNSSADTASRSRRPATSALWHTAPKGQ